MKYKIRGQDLPVVDIELQPKEHVFTESGGMCWMSANIGMETNTRGGVLGGIGRMLAGESLFLTSYFSEEGTGLVSFASEFPGKVIPMKLKVGESIIAQKDAFMVAEGSVKLDVHFHKRLGVGFFGGEGFFLQKLTGPGTVFLELAGEITEYTLKEGQQLKVDQGYIAAFEPTIEFDITRVKGLKNIFFSGEGLFLGTLTGPGKVWLQSMPIAALAKKIIPYLPQQRRR